MAVGYTGLRPNPTLQINLFRAPVGTIFLSSNIVVLVDAQKRVRTGKIGYIVMP